MNALLLFIVGAILACWAVAELVAYVDRRRPHQHDWIAERHRRITHRGFKSRAGMRS